MGSSPGSVEDYYDNEGSVLNSIYANKEFENGNYDKALLYADNAYALAPNNQIKTWYNEFLYKVKQKQKELSDAEQKASDDAYKQQIAETNAKYEASQKAYQEQQAKFQEEWKAQQESFAKQQAEWQESFAKQQAENQALSEQNSNLGQKVTALSTTSSIAQQNANRNNAGNYTMGSANETALGHAQLSQGLGNNIKRSSQVLDSDEEKNKSELWY